MLRWGISASGAGGGGVEGGGPHGGRDGGEEGCPQERRGEPGNVLAPRVAVDDDLADVALSRRDRVDTQEELAGPALLRARGQLGRREESGQQEEAEREAHAVRAGKHANNQAE